MTYALIDNATLTAVQRIQGVASTKSKDSVDIDIVALENLVQAILFYDQIIAIDDYIPQYRDDRKSAFPYIRFLNAGDFNIDKIEVMAAEKANDLRPKLHGGEFANPEFRGLIELLQTHIVCTWDIYSSVYHLTLKSLSGDATEFHKYGNIAAGIFSELGDAAELGNKVQGNVELLDRYGKPIGKGYRVPGARWGDGTSSGEASGAIKAFVASLIWMANRSILYTLTAKYLRADTFLYPIRQAYQQNYVGQACNYGSDYPRHIVEHFSSSLNSDLVQIQNAGLATATGTSLPMFSAWLANQTRDPAQVINMALEIRDNSEFVQAREQLRDVKRLFDESEITDANRAVSDIISEIDKASIEMKIKYGIETKQGKPITKLVHVYNTFAALNGLPVVPEYSFKVKLPDFLHTIVNPKGFNSVYRNLTNDLTTVWSLGETRDILGSKVSIEKNARAYNPKQEQPQYRNSHSPFKSPM